MRRWIASLVLLLMLASGAGVLAGGHESLGEHYSAPAGVGSELFGTRLGESELEDWIAGEPRHLLPR